MGLFNSNKKEVKEVSRPWYEEMQEKYADNTKKAFLLDTNIYRGNLIILTNDNKIIFIQTENCKTIENIIDIADIMKANIVAVTSTKSVERLFTLRDTMEQIQQIQGYELKLITFDKVYRISVKTPIGNKEKALKVYDQFEILDAYLERKIKNNEF